MNRLLERIKKAYRFETDAEVANFLDMKPSTLSMQKNRGRLNLERIIEKCAELNKNWLLDGTGQMWNQEQSGRCKIPIYSSLTLANGNELDHEESVQSGDIFTDICPNRLDFPITEQLIGLSVSGDPAVQMLQKNDIVFIDLSKKGLQEERSYLLLTDHQVTCARIKKQSGEYVIHEDDSTAPGPNGDFSIIGEVVFVMRRCDL